MPLTATATIPSPAVFRNQKIKTSNPRRQMPRRDDFNDGTRLKPRRLLGLRDVHQTEISSELALCFGSGSNLYRQLVGITGCHDDRREKNAEKSKIAGNSDMREEPVFLRRFSMEEQHMNTLRCLLRPKRVNLQKSACISTPSPSFQIILLVQRGRV